MKGNPEVEYKFYSPANTEEILKVNIVLKSDTSGWKYESSVNFVKNPNLLFSKFIPVNERKDNKDKYLSLVQGEIERLIQEEIPWLSDKSKKLLAILSERRVKLLNLLQNSGFKTSSKKLELKWRMIIGLGASHPQETSMTLHHIYGIPYIPGSAVKGVARHSQIIKLFENTGVGEWERIKKMEEILETDLKKLDKMDENDEIISYAKNHRNEIETFQKVFGTQSKKGEVIFFDAYPAGEIKLKIDIMNPHYGDYYSGEEAPTDWQNPTPIKFLTVENTEFNFILASKDKNLLDKAEGCLIEALEKYGIGAKTSLGYGLFKKIDQESK